MTAHPARLVCDVIEASCRCSIAPHDPLTPHECDCGGSWRFDADGTWHLVRLPDPQRTASTAR